MRKLRAILAQNAGMTIVEFLIATLMSLIVGAAAMEFYVSQHESWITQENVSDVQQNLRATAQELSTKLRNAGAALPEGLGGIDAADTNPDTITVRFSATPTTMTVGYHTQQKQAVPIHVERFSSFTGFEVGDRVFLYTPPAGPGEFFTITNLAENAGSGWKEVHHQDQDLTRDPQVGDQIIKLSQNRYWIDQSSDTLHPTLIREVNGVASVYADEIYDLQAQYVLADASVVDAPVAGDTIVAVDFYVAAQTVRRNITVAGDAGRLIRETESRIYLRNRPRVE